MNCSTLGLPVHHQLPEFTQTHVHRVSDAIQPSHPLSSPSPPAPNPSSIRVFSNESTLCMRWPKYWSFSFSIIPSKEISYIHHIDHDFSVHKLGTREGMEKLVLPMRDKCDVSGGPFPPNSGYFSKELGQLSY